MDIEDYKMPLTPLYALPFYAYLRFRIIALSHLRDSAIMLCHLDCLASLAPITHQPPLGIVQRSCIAFAVVPDIAPRVLEGLLLTCAKCAADRVLLAALN